MNSFEQSIPKNPITAGIQDREEIAYQKYLQEEERKKTPYRKISKEAKQEVSPLEKNMRMLQEALETESALEKKIRETPEHLLVPMGLLEQRYKIEDIISNILSKISPADLEQYLAENQKPE